MPTVKGISGPYRFFFYSFDCNEPEHIHVQRDDEVCKFWLIPVNLSQNFGFSNKELNRIQKKVEANLEQIINAWYEHCK